MTQSTNPLRAFFRQPAIYMRLPSDGEFWPTGSIEIPQNRELPVLPMTAIDEISYRTPDALFNGAAVVSVVQSCVPAIKDAWKIPNCDFATIMAAIRIASYGKLMPLTSQCPSCSAQNDFEVDLQQAMDQLSASDFSKTVTQGDLVIYFRPISYKEQNHINLQQFEQSRVIAMLPSAEMPEEEKTNRLNDAIKSMTRITVAAMSLSIQSIQTPQSLVTEIAYIEDFLMNCDRKLFNAIRDHIVELRINDEFRPVKMQCAECKTEYEQKFTLDTAGFFETAS